MRWKWLPAAESAAVDEAAVLDLLVASSRDALLAAGLPEAMASLLAAQQARARLVGHAAAHPAAEELMLAVPRAGDPHPAGSAEDSGASADAPLAGRLLLDRAGPSWHVVDVVVHPRWRGQGAATWMLGWLAAQADLAGRTVTLRVDRGSPAVRLYARAGFVETGGDELDLVMARPAGHPPAT